MTLFSYLIVLIVLGAGVLAILGWRDWAVRRGQAEVSRWRSTATLVALIFLSAATLLFVGYGGHNTLIGGDRNGNALSLLCIRSGNYLSVAAIVLSFGGKGRGRWLVLAGGCFILVLWLAQGMSL